METSQANAVQAGPPLRRGARLSGENFCAARRDASPRYSVTGVVRATSKDCVRAAATIAASPPMTMGLKGEPSVLMAAPFAPFDYISVPPLLVLFNARTTAIAAVAAVRRISAAFPADAADSTIHVGVAVVRVDSADASAFARDVTAVNRDDVTSVRATLNTKISAFPASVPSSVASVPLIGGGGASASIAAPSLPTASAAALAGTGAAASTSLVAAGVSRVASDSSEAPAILAATCLADRGSNLVSTAADFSASFSDESICIAAAISAACGTPIPFRLPAKKRVVGAENAAVALLRADDYGLRQQHQQQGGAELTVVTGLPQKHQRLGIYCFFLASLCSPTSRKPIMIQSMSVNQPKNRSTKDKENFFSDCCCDASAVAVTTSSAVQASPLLTETKRVCPALWHSYVFCCNAHVGEKHQSHSAIITLLFLVLLTFTLYAALTANAAFALHIDTAARAGIPLTTYVAQQHPLAHTGIARFPGRIRLVSNKTAPLAAAGGDGRRAAGIDNAGSGNCATWKCVALRVRIFHSSAIDSVNAPPDASRFSTTSKYCTVLAGMSLPHSNFRRSEPVAIAAGTLLNLETNFAAVPAGAASTACLTRARPSRRATAAVAVVSQSGSQSGSKTYARANSAASLLRAFAQRKRSTVAAPTGDTIATPVAPSSAASARGAPVAPATFAAAAYAAGSFFPASCMHGGAPASAYNQAQFFALIPSLRLQAPVVELQLPRLLLRLPLRALSIHLRYKLYSPRSSRSSCNSDNDKYANGSSSNIRTRRRHSDSRNTLRTSSRSDRNGLHKSGDNITSSDSGQWNSGTTSGNMSRSRRPHSAGEEEDSNRNDVQDSYSSLDSRRRISEKLDLRKESYSEEDAVSNGTNSTVDSRSERSTVCCDNSSETRSKTAEDKEQGGEQRRWLQQKGADEATAALKLETGDGKGPAEWEVPKGLRKVYVREIVRGTLVEPAAATELPKLDEGIELKTALQQDASIDKQGRNQQQRGGPTPAVHESQHQEGITWQDSHGAETASKKHVQASFFDGSFAAGAPDSAEPPLSKADISASVAADPAAAAAAQTAVAAAPTPTRGTAVREARIAREEGAGALAALTIPDARGTSGAKRVRGSSVGVTAISRRISGVAYEPTEATAAAAKVGEKVLLAIAAIREMLRAWTSPSIGIDIHPASNTFCFVAEAFPLKPAAAAAASWSTEKLFHFFFPQSAAALLRLSLFPDGFCMISSAVISPAAIISHLLLLFSSRRSRKELIQKPEKRLLLQGGLQHRWVEKFTQLLQLQLVAGGNLLQAVFAPRSAFFTLLLLGRPPCCPRGMRRCYRKAVYRQQRRLWKQQHEQLWRTQQQEEPWQQLQGVWEMQNNKLKQSYKEPVASDSLWWKRWRSSTNPLQNESATKTLFHRDLAFLVLRSGAVGDAREEDNNHVGSGSETFVTRLSFVATGSSTSSSDVNNSNRSSMPSAAIDSDTEDQSEEGNHGEQMQSEYLHDNSSGSSNNMKDQNTCAEPTLPLATEECSSRVLQSALRRLRLLRVPSRRKKSMRSYNVTDPVLIDYREAAAAARDATPTLQFSSRFLNKLIGEAQLFCSAVARGTVQWSNSDAGAAVDLQQMLRTANRRRRRYLQRMQIPYLCGTQQQLIRTQKEAEHHKQQQQMQKQQRTNQEELREVQNEGASPSKKDGGRAPGIVESGTGSEAGISEAAALASQQSAALERQQQITLQQRHLQEQAPEEENFSPWSILLRAGDARVDVDHLTLRLEFVPADTAAAAGPQPHKRQHLT